MVLRRTNRSQATASTSAAIPVGNSDSTASKHRRWQPRNKRKGGSWFEGPNRIILLAIFVLVGSATIASHFFSIWRGIWWQRGGHGHGSVKQNGLFGHLLGSLIGGRSVSEDEKDASLWEWYYEYFDSNNVTGDGEYEYEDYNEGSSEEESADDELLDPVAMAAKQAEQEKAWKIHSEQLREKIQSLQQALEKQEQMHHTELEARQAEHAEAVAKLEELEKLQGAAGGGGGDEEGGAKKKKKKKKGESGSGGDAGGGAKKKKKKKKKKKE